MHYDNLLYNISNPAISHDLVIESFYKYINNSIDQVFRKHKPKNLSNSFPSNKWFDLECKHLKAKVNESYRINAPLGIQTGLRNEYKRVVQLKKRHFQSKESKKLNNLCTYRQTDFWKNWKQLKGHVTNYDHIKIDTFTEFYSDFCKPMLNPIFDNPFMSDLHKAMRSYGDGDEKPSDPIIYDI